MRMLLEVSSIDSTNNEEALACRSILANVYFALAVGSNSPRTARAFRDRVDKELRDQLAAKFGDDESPGLGSALEPCNPQTAEQLTKQLPPEVIQYCLVRALSSLPPECYFERHSNPLGDTKLLNFKAFEAKVNPLWTNHRNAHIESPTVREVRDMCRELSMGQYLLPKATVSKAGSPTWLTPSDGEVAGMVSELRDDQSSLHCPDNGCDIQNLLGLDAPENCFLIALETKHTITELQQFALASTQNIFLTGPSSPDSHGSERFRQWPTTTSEDPFGRTYDLDRERRAACGAEEFGAKELIYNSMTTDQIGWVFLAGRTKKEEADRIRRLQEAHDYAEHVSGGLKTTTLVRKILAIVEEKND